MEQKKNDKYYSSRLELRLNQELMNKLSEQATRYTQGNKSEYLRRLIVGADAIKLQIPTIKKETTTRTKALYELNKIGNNLNQLTLKVNRGQIVFSAEVLATLQEVKQIIEDFIKNNPKKSQQ